MSNFLPVNTILELFATCKRDINSVCDLPDEQDIVDFIRAAVREKTDYLRQEKDNGDHLDARYKQENLYDSSNVIS